MRSEEKKIQPDGADPLEIGWRLRPSQKPKVRILQCQYFYSIFLSIKLGVDNTETSTEERNSRRSQKMQGDGPHRMEEQDQGAIGCR